MKEKSDLNFDSVPKLAPPRKEIWKNLTFLHGVIDEDKDPEGKNLILTKTDFGLAYLHDNWASRFIIQLFQDFTVLFIGYSINDPIMNYLVSAISYENKRRRENEGTGNHKTISKKRQNTKPSIYAFVAYKGGANKKKEEEDKWKSIGVEPISYKVKKEDHSLLYDTIKSWAELKKSGLAGRKNWLKQKLEKPYREETDRYQAETVISTLKMDEKLAEYLPEINLSSDLKKRKPVDISWLKAFAGEKKEHGNNAQDNISLPSSKFKSYTKNSLLKKLTYRTAQSSPYPLWEPLSPIEENIAKWLLHHLDKKELIHWLIKQTSIQHGVISLHPKFKDMLKWNLKHIQEKSNETLDERKSLFWKIITTQKEYSRNIGSFHLGNPISELNEQYSYEKTKKLLSYLKPMIGFEENFYREKLKQIRGSDRIYEAKLTINANDYPYESLTNEKTLLSHAENFSNLLKGAMELAKWVGLIDKNGDDLFYIQKPSIAEHGQNRNYHSWTYLIDLVRDSFDLAMAKDKKLAEFLLSKWQFYPYSLFYRLIFYAVTKHYDLDEEIAIKLFTEKTDQTLWSSSCKYEVLKFLRDRKHSEKAIQKILSLIVKGPFRPEGIEEASFVEYKEREIYLRLHHLKFSEVQFPKKIEKLYKELPSKYSFKPSTRKDADREGFSFYLMGPTQIGSEKRYHNMTCAEIFKEIKHTKPNTLPFLTDKKENFRFLTKDCPDKAFEVLSMFSDNNINSAPYWGGFISKISVITDTQKSNDYFLKSFKKIMNYSDEFFKKCLWSLIDGLNLKGVLIYHKDKEVFKKWWNRLWNLSITEEESNNNDISFSALNSHLGKLSQSIFRILWSQFPNGKITKNRKIPKDIKEYFYPIIQEGKERNPSALFHFGSDLSQLWYLDREWTIKNLKPLMNWDKQKKFSYKNKPIRPLSSSAKNSQFQNLTKTFKPSKSAWRALWQGYLFYNMFLGPDFLEDFKEEFFQLVLNYEQVLSNSNDSEYLSNVARIFFVTTGGREIQNIFTKKEVSQLIQKIGIDILEPLSWIMWRDLEDSEKGKSNDLYGF